MADLPDNAVIHQNTFEEDLFNWLRGESGINVGGSPYTYPEQYDARSDVNSSAAAVENAEGNVMEGDLSGYSGAVSLALADPSNAYNAWQAMLQREHATSERLAAQEYSSAEAVKAFERELSADSTKYQRVMRDLQAAGINPLYAFGSGGASASSVNSSSASSSPGSGSSATAGSSSSKAIASVFSAIAKLLGTLA